LLFTEELVREIVEQTNLYATQTNATSFSPISVEEFYGFIGIMIAMGLCKLHTYIHTLLSDSQLGFSMPITYYS
jgi:hypothetical protein